MAQDFEALKRLFNAFEPFRPLYPDDPAYVDCRAVRGDSDIEAELGREILYSDSGISCQLYAGHRGGGKSTELLRLQRHLEQNRCFVVYFPADDRDIDAEDTQYTDILLACTRHLLEDLEQANPQPVLNWLRDRWDTLKDLAQTEISLDDVTAEVQIAQFAKLNANLKAVPDLRHKIREQVNPHTITLLKALNDFISDAKRRLPADFDQLAIIADNLDRIVPVPQEDGRSNHEHIFLDRSEQLKALACHVIYTVPISMVYSPRAVDLRGNYGDSDRVLPMIMVRRRNDQVYPPGLEKLKEAIRKRLDRVKSSIPLKTELFDSDATLTQICLMSGGHIRELLLLIRSAIKRADRLPIPRQAVLYAVTEARNTYRRSIEDDQWSALASVARSKRILNDDLHRSMLFNRCILEYCDASQDRWYDVHPLIEGIEEFKDALAQITPTQPPTASQPATETLS